MASAPIASLHSTPQLAIGALTPRPTKLRNASVKIACGMEKVSVTRMGPIALGMRCRSSIRAPEAPRTRAARTNSSFLIRMTSDLTIRAMEAQ